MAKIIDKIVQSATEPSKNDLWLHDGKLQANLKGKWESIGGGSGGGVQIVDSIDELKNSNVPNGSIVSLAKNDYVDFSKLRIPVEDDFNLEDSNELFIIKNINNFSNVENINLLEIDTDLLNSTIEKMSTGSAFGMLFYDVTSPIKHPITISIVITKILPEDVGNGVLVDAGLAIIITGDEYWAGGDYTYADFAIIRTVEGTLITTPGNMQDVWDVLEKRIPKYDFVFGGYINGIGGNRIQEDLSSYFECVKIPKSNNVVYQMMNNKIKELSFKEDLLIPTLTYIPPQDGKIKGYRIYPNIKYIIDRKADVAAGTAYIEFIEDTLNTNVYTIELRNMYEIRFSKDLMWKDGNALSMLDINKIYIVTIKNNLASYEEYYNKEVITEE